MFNFNKLKWHEKLKVLRATKGWSQEEAGEQCGTNKKGYWGWENNKCYPRRNSRRAIGLAYEVTEEEIFCEIDN